MKLQIKARYGQRESEWSSTLLGYNIEQKYNIGNWGCLITSFGNYIGKTPLEINNLLKNNNGFVSGSGNFIWGKCTVLGLTQVYSSPTYTAAVTSQGITKMKALLDEGRPLITHVDFDPSDADDDQHWLLVYGYENDTFFAYDPWSNSDITLDVYGGVARAVIEFKAYDLILPKEVDMSTDSMVIAKIVFKKLVTKSSIKDEISTYLIPEISTDETTAEQLKNVIAGIKSRSTDMENRANKAEAEVSNREEQVSRLKVDIANLNNLIKSTEDSLNSNVTQYRKLIEVYKGQLEGKQEELNKFAKDLGAERIKVAELEAKQSFEEILKFAVGKKIYKLILMK